MLQKRRLRDVEFGGEIPRRDPSRPLVIAFRPREFEHLPLGRGQAIEATLSYGSVRPVRRGDPLDGDLGVRVLANPRQCRFDPRALAREPDLPVLAAVLDPDRLAVDEAVFEQHRTDHIAGIVLQKELSDDVPGSGMARPEPLL